MSLLLLPGIAFVACVVLHLCALKFYPRWNLLDFPERYGLKRSPIPYPTGIIAVVVFLVLFSFVTDLTRQNVGLMLAVAFLAISSFIDDRRPLPPQLRLCVQLVAALCIFLTGTCVGSQICSVTNPLAAWTGAENLDLTLWKIGPFPIFAALFTLAWIGLTTNALNWFDGIPGQVNTLSALGFLTVGLLALSDRVNQPHVALLAFILAALAFGCLLFDFPPAKVVMGDSGAMFFGLMLGVLTVYAGGKVATAFLVLGVPLIDLFIVVGKRLLNGKSPIRGSHGGEHLHHRLLASGWTARQVIALNAVLGLCFGTAALFMDTLQKFIAGLVLFVVILGLSMWARPK